MSQPLQAIPGGSSSRKTGGLWSYILPPATSTSTPAPDSDAAAQLSSSTSTSLPATGPSDRSAVSVRLMLGDAKAALQQLSDRVERVADEAANARREVAEASRGVEEAQGGMLKQVQVIVKQVVTSLQEANIAHTSSLEAASARIVNFEASLAAQTRAISDLSQTCAANQLKISELTDRITQTHSAVLSLSPIIPLLQAIPAEIANAQLKTTNAVEHLQVESLRTARDMRLDLEKLSEEQTRATLSTVSQLFGARDRAWKELLDDVVGHTRRDLEKCREEWSDTLSVHRQEVCGLLSAHLATSMHACVHEAADTSPPAKPSTIVNDVLGRNSLPDISVRTGQQLGQAATPHASSTTPHPIEPLHGVDKTSTTRQRASFEIVEEACGLGGSIYGTSYEAEKFAKTLDVKIHTNRQHGQSDTTHLHTSINPPDSFSPVVNPQPEHELEPMLEIESQSTALSPPPDLDEPVQELEDSQDLAIETQEENTSNDRLFGDLNRPNRTHSVNFDLTTPDSPPFSVNRQNITVEEGPLHQKQTADPRAPSTSTRPQAGQWTDPRVPNPVIDTSPWPGSAESAYTTTLGRSSSQSSFSCFTSPLPTTTFRKRINPLHRQGPAKRQKTRILMTAEDYDLGGE